MNDARSLAFGFSSLAKNFADDSSFSLFSGIGSAIGVVVGLDKIFFSKVLILVDPAPDRHKDQINSGVQDTINFRSG